jgi:peptide/nickel transport system permease protein
LISYILQRLFYGLTVLFGVVTLVFFLFNLKPGDPARMLGGQFADEATIRNINRDLGLDKPLLSRYALYLNDLSLISWHQVKDAAASNYLDSSRYSYVPLLKTGDGAMVLKWPYLRRSYQSKRNVSTIIAEAVPGTAVLALVAIAIAFIAGLLLGIISALNQNKFTDQVILFISVIGMSGPSFFVAIIFSWLGGYLWSDGIELPVIPVVVCLFWTTLSWFYLKREKKVTFNHVFRNFTWSLLAGIALHVIIAVVLGYDLALLLPGTGLRMTGSLYSIDPFEGKVFTPSNLVLPALTLGIRPLAVIVQLTRSSLLDVMEQDYIRTARAKGLSERAVLYGHALKNALNPVITAVSGWFASLLAGAVFIEFVFGWKGLGLEVFQALEKDDLPVVTGAVLFFALVFVIMNILVDWLYGLLDPRVRIQ